MFVALARQNSWSPPTADDRARKETGALAARFTTAEILRRVRCLEELRDHLESQYSGSAGRRSCFPGHFYCLNRLDAILKQKAAT